MPNDFTPVGQSDLMFLALTLTKQHNKIISLREFAGPHIKMVMGCLEITAQSCERASNLCNENIVKKAKLIMMPTKEFDSFMAAVSLGAILIVTLEYHQEKKQAADDAAKKALDN